MEYTAAMKTILPLLYQRMIGVLANHSQASVTFQHHILKIFYATMQVGIIWMLQLILNVWGGEEGVYKLSHNLLGVDTECPF